MFKVKNFNTDLKRMTRISRIMVSIFSCWHFVQKNPCNLRNPFQIRVKKLL